MRLWSNGPRGRGRRGDSRYPCSLGEDSQGGDGLGDAAYTDDIGGGSEVAVVFLGGGVHLAEGAHHDLL